MPTWEDIVEVRHRFPEDELTPGFGTPALKVRNRGMLCRCARTRMRW